MVSGPVTESPFVTPKNSIVMPPEPKLVLLLLSWLIPGYGFYRHGLRVRGLILFVLIESTFLVGVMFQGAVLVPEFNYRSEGFNLVAILTFVTQMFNGLAACLSAVADLTGGAVRLLPGNELNQWSDLGTFYLLMSGGLNYFALTGTYDHFYGFKSRSAATIVPTADTTG